MRVNAPEAHDMTHHSFALAAPGPHQVLLAQMCGSPQDCTKPLQQPVEWHHATELHATEHYATEHHGTEHYAIEHHATEHHVSEHHATEHHASEHHVSEHHATEHHASEHHATERGLSTMQLCCTCHFSTSAACRVHAEPSVSGHVLNAQLVHEGPL